MIWLTGRLQYHCRRLILLVIGDNEARPHYLQQVDLRCVGHVCSWMFYRCGNLTDVCLLKQGGSRYPPTPYTSLKAILPGMWYEIKQKQQKMPKARANITVYSSRRLSGCSLILSCLTVSFSCGIVYSRVKRTPEIEKRRRTYMSSNGISKTKLLRIYPLLF